jgi:hypothetical protein
MESKFKLGQTVTLAYFTTGNTPPVMTVSGIVDRGDGGWEYLCSYMHCGDPREVVMHQAALRLVARQHEIEAGAMPEINAALTDPKFGKKK